jgi:hypothetical protein
VRHATASKRTRAAIKGHGFVLKGKPQVTMDPTLAASRDRRLRGQLTACIEFSRLATLAQHGLVSRQELVAAAARAGIRL